MWASDARMHGNVAHIKGYETERKSCRGGLVGRVFETIVHFWPTLLEAFDY